MDAAFMLYYGKLMYSPTGTSLAWMASRLQLKYYFYWVEVIIHTTDFVQPKLDTQYFQWKEVLLPALVNEYGDSLPELNHSGHDMYIENYLLNIILSSNALNTEINPVSGLFCLGSRSFDKWSHFIGFRKPRRMSCLDLLRLENASLALGPINHGLLHR